MRFGWSGGGRGNPSRGTDAKALYRARGEARGARWPCARALSGETEGNWRERLTEGTHCLAGKQENDDGRATGCKGGRRSGALGGRKPT